MGLTADTELNMVDSGLVDFYGGAEAHFLEMATVAYKFTDGNIRDTGLPVRLDDVAESLEIALKTYEPLREFLAGKKLRQNYQYRNFADLTLDRTWEQLANNVKDGDNDDQ